MKKTITLLAIAFCLNTNAQIINTFAGNGLMGFSGDGGQAAAAKLNGPSGVAFDAAGNKYIVDWYNNRIRKVTTAGVISTIAGNGTMGFSGDGGQATAAGLYQPTGIALDAAGNIYIVDQQNNRIRKVNTSGIISTYAGNGVQGYSGDGSAAVLAELNQPTNIAIDAAGNLCISDYGNHRIRKVTTAGIISTVAGNGTGNFSGDGGQATVAEINFPYGVSFDVSGNLYIADGTNRIRKVNTSGIITTVAGNGTPSFSGDGGQATAATINGPNGVTFDASSNMYIADASNNRIRKVNTLGVITTFAGNGTAGYSGDGGQATAAELNLPVGVTIDASGILYISDVLNNRVRALNTTTGIAQLNDISEQVIIYPNPTSNGSFVIETNATTKLIVNVYDITGKIVLSQSINGAATIDASKLNEGVYNVNITSSEGVVNKRLVIVK